MDDVRLVRRLERRCHLQADPQCSIGWQGSLRQQVLERVTWDVLEYEKPFAGVFFDSVDGGDVRMIERREKARFALESSKCVIVTGERFGKQLDRNLAPESRIRRAIDHAHSARAKRVENFIRTEARSGGDVH